MPTRRPSSPARAARRGDGGAPGFSLLEVIVALAILGIGLGVVLQSIGQGLRLRGSAGESVTMAVVAERLLGGLTERANAPRAAEEGEEGDCRWRIEAVERPARAPAADGAPRPAGAEDLVEVRVTVTGSSGSSWELVTLLPRAPKDLP